MELLLEHFVPYLAHEVKFIYPSQFLMHKGIEFTLLSLREEEVYKKQACLIGRRKDLTYGMNVYGRNARMILRPLSDLTREILIDGELIKPCDYLVTSRLGAEEWGDVEGFNYKNLRVCDYELLCKWYFDVFKLIPQGLAEDFNEFYKEVSFQG